MTAVRFCPGCRRPTRSARVKVADSPGTVIRRKGEWCDTCHDDAHSARVGNSLENTVAGLEAYLNRRRARISA